MTPDAWAVRELERLRHSVQTDSADTAVVTEELITILRDYLELQFGIAATIQTSDELLTALEKDGRTTRDARQRFAGLLRDADLARFAGLQLSRDQLIKSVDDAQQILELVRSTQNDPVATREMPGVR